MNKLFEILPIVIEIWINENEYKNLLKAFAEYFLSRCIL